MTILMCFQKNEVFAILTNNKFNPINPQYKYITSKTLKMKINCLNQFNPPPYQSPNINHQIFNQINNPSKKKKNQMNK